VGTGQKDFAWPNVARLWIGEALAGGQLVQIETNIDDMNPELYAAVSQQLFAAGALDVWLTPIQMKKGRPGVLLSVLAPSAQESVMADLLLRETTTLGVRVHPVQRHEAKRELVKVATRYGAITVKLKRIGGAVIGAKPEYEECLTQAQAHNTPVRRVYEAALAAAQTYITEA
jgi:pyridinium-3,5-bisthiocarboxylic acid mononucleotide nickel chelatase